MIRQKIFFTENTLLKFYWPVCIILLTISAVWILIAPRSTNEVVPRMDTGMVIDALPLSFVANIGQFHPDVHFTVRSLGGTLQFSLHKIAVNLNNSNTDSIETNMTKALSIVFENGNPDTLIRGQEKRTGIVNYFLGNNPAFWYTNAPTYGGISYTNLYPGIDLRYEGRGGQLKSTYIVAPYANPHQISWQYQGASDVSIEAETGDLLIYVGDSESPYILREQAPIAWQTIANRQQIVDVRYVIAENRGVGFSLGVYDPAYPIIIDPMLLAYSTYLGGSGWDWGEAVAVDNSGNVYVSGITASDNFPTRNTFDDSLTGGVDVFVTKIDPTKNGDDSLVYSTYLGGSGSNAAENGLGIVVDSAGNAYITGFVQSNDFPTVNAYDTTKGNGPFGDDTSNDTFVTKLNPAGNVLLYSTYLGGEGGEDDIAHGIAVDDAGNAYVAGETRSDDFPIQNAYQSSINNGGAVVYKTDGFITKLDTTQSGTASLVYSSYLGGSVDNVITGIVADHSGKVYISGRTNSTDFPVRNAYQSGYAGGNSDVFVAELDTTESGDASLVYSSYLGGSGHDGDDDPWFSHSYIGGITQDGAGNIYLTGVTQSSNFPTKNAFQSSNAGGYDAFVSKFDLTQSNEDSLIYSTYLGGNNNDFGYELVANNAGNIFVTGFTESINFPTRLAYQKSYNDNRDAFVTTFDVIGTSLLFSTYFGGNQEDVAMGIAVDSMDSIYLIGGTSSGNFPVRNAFDSSLNGDIDGFVAKFVESSVSVYLPIILRK